MIGATPGPSKQGHRTPTSVTHCIGSESSAATWKQLRADHKLEQIKKNPKQRSLWIGFMSEEDLLGLILNRIKYHSQGEYYASDLLLNDRVLPRKAADEPSELQLFPHCCRKRRDWSRKLFFYLFQFSRYTAGVQYVSPSGDSAWPPLLIFRLISVLVEAVEESRQAFFSPCSRKIRWFFVTKWWRSAGRKEMWIWPRNTIGFLGNNNNKGLSSVKIGYIAPKVTSKVRKPKTGAVGLFIHRPDRFLP